MKTQVLIIEDEPAAARRLLRILKDLRPYWDIAAILDTVRDSVVYLTDNQPDLIFMDIQLADGNSFAIFNEVSVRQPIIFTTAFDDFAIDAFKLNSIDYLLKPIDEAAVNLSIEKFERNRADNTDYLKLIQSIQNLRLAQQYKKRFLIRVGEHLKSIEVGDIAYIYSQDSLTFAMIHTGRAFPLDGSLESIEKVLHPDEFFRISRRMIIGAKSIKTINSWLNGRLKVTLVPTAPVESLVARERVHDFKAWLDR